MSEATDDRESYRINDDPDQVEQERARLHTLAAVFDPRTREVLTDLGVGPGWCCLDVGAGAGTVAAWLAACVAPDGVVHATDVDTRFLPAPTATLEVHEHDVVNDDLPWADLDLVHARGVLQHLAQRDEVMTALVGSLRPGGHLVVQDSDWIQFDEQEVPEPFATLSRVMRDASEQQHGHDAALGRRFLGALAERGLVDVTVEARAFTMRGGTPSAEWYVAALARAAPFFVEAGMLDGDLVDAAIAQARDPGFAILSPLSVTAQGTKP